MGKRTHYKHGCHFGRMAAAYVFSTQAEQTQDIASVDCKDCLRIIKQFDLKPRSDFPDIPTFAAKAEGRYISTDGKEGCYLVFRCPVCGKENAHGGLFGDPGAGDGHRVAHCDCWEDGYYIEETEGGVMANES